MTKGTAIPRAETLLAGALKFGIRPGLARMRAILQALGDPQDRLRVVHVAGTNGKGSTSAMLTSVLRAAGYKVARYTSPHLVRYRERLWLDGAFIAPADFDALIARIARVAEALALRDPELGATTEFELLTAAAFLWFAEEGCDIAVIEVGLGGRLDATNCFAAPELTIITGIALDHTAILGESPEAIAREKAGILRPGVPLVTAATDGALATIRQEAAALGAPIQVVDADSRLPLGLAGPHQRRNAALVEHAVRHLAAKGWQIPAEALSRGLAAARWPGRMETRVDAEGATWLLDGAHNPEGIAALCAALRQDHADVRWTLIFGALADRDARAMRDALLPFARALVLVAPPSPRAMDPAALAEGLDRADVRIAASVPEALDAARSLGGPYAVFGSLYLVGAAMEAMGWLPQP